MTDPRQPVLLCLGDRLWAITYRQKPMFYLHPDVQGIVNEDHAKRIAAEVLGLPHPIPGGPDLSGITAVLVDIDE